MTISKELAQQVLEVLERWDARGRLRVTEALRNALEQQPKQKPVATGQKDDLVSPCEIRARLSQAPKQPKQEATLYEFRTRPNWEGDDGWSDWKNCTKEQAQDYWNRPLVHGWLYEARALYTEPQACDHIADASNMVEQPKQEQYTYTSTQATTCAECGKHKHTPLRIDAMGGYVCLACIDKKLSSLLGEFGHSGQPKQEPVAWHYQSRLGNAYVTDVKAEPSPDWRETPLYTEPPAREWQGLTVEDIKQGFQDSWVTEQAWQSAVWWAEEKLKEKNA